MVKRLTPELRTYMQRLVDMTMEMDREQIKRINRCVKKAFEVCLIMKVRTYASTVFFF